ncbi:MAG TPA: hypothetical protein VF783_15565, partial [Terriglobales bacterium]
MTHTEQAVLTHSLRREEPTLASFWYSLTGGPASDEFLDWPADLFALTDVILGRSEAYRFVLCPPDGMMWPPARIPNWSDAVEAASRQWSVWVENRDGPLPDILAEEWGVFRERAGISFADLAEGHDWRMCEALLTLHAIADEACAGLGAALDCSDRNGCLYRARGRELLARTGSLSRIHTHRLRVLPKVRTPANGTSWRSFSRYACVVRPGVEATWHRMPIRRGGTGPRSRHANLLLLPWPLRVRESDFRPIEDSVQRLSREPYGLFEFAPSERLDLDLMSRLITAARDEVDSVDVVILPESAVDESEINDLEAVLARDGVGMLITGVRQESPKTGRLPGNWVHIGFDPSLEKGRPFQISEAEEWFHVRQNKHHRWSLEERQINQYHLGGALHPYVRWWERTDVPRRAVQLMELGDELTLVSLVCEDLAENDNVAEIIRAVGPTVVVTPLLDGPQLGSRWAARYASVLADDPGSAVLTLTSFGMVQRSRPHGRDFVPAVALWKDPVRGMREIPLEAGAQAILLTVCGGVSTRRTADGRHPVDNTTEQFDVAVHQVRANSVSREPSTAEFQTLAPRPLETDEVTVLTGWAQAVAEVLAQTPERMKELLADAKAEAPWRATLRLAEPSQPLGDALFYLNEVIRAVTPPNATPTTDALLSACS